MPWAAGENTSFELLTVLFHTLNWFWLPNGIREQNSSAAWIAGMSSAVPPGYVPSWWKFACTNVCYITPVYKYWYSGVWKKMKKKTFCTVYLCIFRKLADVLYVCVEMFPLRVSEFERWLLMVGNNVVNEEMVICRLCWKCCGGNQAVEKFVVNSALFVLCEIG